MGDKRCTACGKVIDPNEIYKVNGMSYCEDCVFELDLEYDDEEDEKEPSEDVKVVIKPATSLVEREKETEPAEEKEEVQEEPIEDAEEEEPIEDAEEEESEPETTETEPAKEKEEVQEEPIEDAEEEESEPETTKPEGEKKKRWSFRKEKKEKSSKPKKKTEKKNDENPDPDSFSERFRRAKLMRFKGYVILRTLRRDERTGDFIRESTLIPKSELPRDAVQCTNEKGIYCLDLIKKSEWYLESRADLGMDYWESQFTASDAALYMLTNKIDNALAVNWTDFSHIDTKKYLLMAFIAIGVVALFFMLR